MPHPCSPLHCGEGPGVRYKRFGRKGILNNEAKMLYEEALYREFLKNPETQEIASPEEKANFEKWLEFLLSRGEIYKKGNATLLRKKEKD
jgi:hypothetical protein